MRDAFDSKRNVLLGIFSLQMDLIEPSGLIEAIRHWDEGDASSPLGQALVDKGGLSDRSRLLLEQLVDEQLDRHNGELSAAATTAISLDSFDGSRIGQHDSKHVVETLLNAAEQRFEPPQARQSVTQGRFTLERLHAKGGLGEVFLAEDRELHRRVALKKIKSEIADHPHNRHRFLMEAEITAQLEHPNIVPVYGMGEGSDGRPYYAMKFVDGDSLRDKIERFHESKSNESHRSKRHSIEFRDLLAQFVNVCNAIEFAHSRNIIHRDIKPSNVMLGEYGETLVVDWGLAKALSPESYDEATYDYDASNDTGNATPETAVGKPLGTLSYASPEQISGDIERVDRRSDIYSLGATLFHLLSGEPPFTGSPQAIIEKVKAGQIQSPRQLHGAAPGALEAICRKAMSLKHHDRYESCEALASDVEAWLADEPIEVYQDSKSTLARRWIQRHQLASTGFLTGICVAVIGLTISMWLISGKNSQLQTLNAKLANEQKQTQARYEEAHMLQIDNFQETGAWSDARYGIEQALDTGFESVSPVELKLKLADTLYGEMAMDEWETLITELYEAGNYGDYEADILLQYGDLQLAKGRFAEGRQLVAKALALEQLGFVQSHFAESLLAQDTMAAIEHLEKAAYGSTHLQSHHGLIINLLTLGLSARAEQKLLDARQRFPDDRSLDLLEALHLAISGKTESAAKQFALLDDVFSKSDLDLLAETLNKLGSAAEVMNSWKTGQPDFGYQGLFSGYLGFKQLVDPSFATANNLSIVFARGHSTAALAAYTKVLAVMAKVTGVPAFVTPTSDQPLDEALAAHPDAFLFFLMGTKGIFDGDFAAAVKYFKQATANPSMVPHVEREAWFAYAMCLGKLYLDSGFTDQALIADALAAAHRRVELGELDSVDASQLIAIGLRGEDYDLIDDIVTEQLLRNPRNVGFLQSKMKADFGRQRFANVIATCDKVLEIDETDELAIEMKTKAMDGMREMVAAFE